MYTLSVAEGLTDKNVIAEVMGKTDPDGRHMSVGTVGEAEDFIAADQPDIVWLAASEEGFALAGKMRAVYPETNFIFASDGPEMAIDAFKVHASGYMLMPLSEEMVLAETLDLRHPVREDEKRLQIHCFGNFEVFRNGRRIRFARSLSKEALAYLVDRRGAGCTVSEMCAVLWENRPVDTNLKSQCRVILASLKNDLKEAGAGDVLVKGWNTWSIDTAKVSCDYYDFLQGEGTAEETFRGEYMTQYSWAEPTGGSLYQWTNE